MRMFIFRFAQVFAIKFKLKTDDLLLIDYLSQFFVDGKAAFIQRNGRRYWWIRYNKLMTDLPIIGTTPKPFRRIFIKLEGMKLVERLVENQKDLYVWLNWEEITKQSYPYESALPTGKDNSIAFPISKPKLENPIKRIPNWSTEPCPIGNTIVDYNNKKIIIKMDTALRKLSDYERIEKLTAKLKSELQSKISSEAFGQFFKYMFVDEINDTQATIRFVTRYQDPNDFENHKINLDETLFGETVQNYIPQLKSALEKAITKVKLKIENVG